jgi:hypothetical protein
MKIRYLQDAKGQVDGLLFDFAAGETYSLNSVSNDHVARAIAEFVGDDIPVYADEPVTEADTVPQVEPTVEAQEPVAE